MNYQPGDPILSAQILNDVEVGSSGYYAFVEFRNSEEANRAFCLSNISLLGYVIKLISNLK